jgi:hypothetical protein
MLWVFTISSARGHIAGYAQAGSRFAAAQYLFQHGVVAEGRFNKQLGLFQAFGLGFPVP